MLRCFFRHELSKATRARYARTSFAAMTLLATSTAKLLDVPGGSICIARHYDIVPV